MKTVLSKAKKILGNPLLRPIEIWVFRALIAYIAVKLGIDVGKAAGT